MIRAYIGGILLILGGIVFLIALLGVKRFGYILNRLHASAIADTLGTLLIVLGLIVLKGFSMGTLKLIVIVAIMWLTSPLATNRIAAAEVSSSDEYKKHCKCK